MPEAPPEFEAAWARFQSLDHLVVGPETLESAWAHGRDRYAALLIPVDDPATVAHIRALLAHLAGIPGVEPYPEPYWHITIKGIGFVAKATASSDEVSTEQLETVSRLTGEVLAPEPPFEVQAGRVNAFPEVVFVEAWDAGRVRDLNTRLLEAVPGIIRQPFDGPAFLPHTSIARFTSQAGLAQLKAALAGMRATPPGPTFAASHVDLICAHLSASAPALELLRRYELTS